MGNGQGAHGLLRCLKNGNAVFGSNGYRFGNSDGRVNDSGLFVMLAHLQEFPKDVNDEGLPDAQERQKAVNLIGGKEYLENVEVGLRWSGADIDGIFNIENLSRFFQLWERA